MVRPTPSPATIAHGDYRLSNCMMKADGSVAGVLDWELCTLGEPMADLGGLLGYWLVDQLHDYLPYFLVVASSSFAYVALADLIPQLQKQLSARQTVAQIIWLFIGMGLVTLVSGLAHGH